MRNRMAASTIRLESAMKRRGGKVRTMHFIWIYIKLYVIILPSILDRLQEKH